MADVCTRVLASASGSDGRMGTAVCMYSSSFCRAGLSVGRQSPIAAVISDVFDSSSGCEFVQHEMC